MDPDDAGTRGGGPAAATPAAGYPPEAVEWLVGSGPGRLLEVGAGTGAGELTGLLCAQGFDVIATDPSAQLLAQVPHHAPRARVAVARAEDLPLPASSADTVVAAGDLDSFDCFDASRALPEIARVLKPGGVLAVIRTSGDHKVPWVRKLLALVEVSPPSLPANPFESSELFILTERRSFRQWQRFDLPALVGFVGASLKAVSLPPAERDALLAEAAALYDSYGRGPDGLLMPWLVDCYRARPVGAAAVVSADATDDGLLIDFS